MSDLVTALDDAVEHQRGGTFSYLFARARDELTRLRAENERLLYNEPDDSAADGVTVLEVWRKEAARALSKDLTADKEDT